jgi:HK97 family phage major capsid protein
MSSFEDRKASPFAAYARCLLLGKGSTREALNFATNRRLVPTVIDALKSAVEAGTTVSADYSSLAPYRTISDAFLESMGAFSAFDRILQAGAFRSVPLRTRIVLTSSAATGYLVAEGDAKPMSKLELSNSQLTERKVTATLVMAEELLKQSGAAALNLLSNELRRSVGIASDGVFLSAIAEASDVSSIASTGTSAAQITNDLTEALDDLSYGSDARLFLVCPVQYAKRIAMARGTAGSPAFPDATVLGGSINGITIVPSDAAMDALLIDAAQIAASSDTIVLDSSEHASVQMDDSPTSGVVAMVSLWQQNLRGLRAHRVFGCELLRSSAAVVITGTTA